MSGNRRSAARQSCLQAAIDQLESRRLLTTVTATVPAGWVAEPDYVFAQPLVSGAAGQTTAQGATPDQIRGGYGVSNISFNGITGDGSGQTIAIVDAYDDPNAASDLIAFDAAMGLPNPPSFQKLNDQGQTSPLPGLDPSGPGAAKSWEVEESLDIEWAHVIAPQANIILFEATDSGQDLDNTVSTAAATPGVSVVSMSWGGAEFAQETSLDSIFTTPAGHSGVTFLAAAGDNGEFAVDQDTVQPQYPATSPNVVAVGGTDLTVDSNDNWLSETAWGNGSDSWESNGGGGGISAYEPQPSYQKGIVSAFSKTQRVYPDVSMEADPNNGVAIYDSYDFGASTPWAPTAIGGTSLAAPMMSALVAIADQGRQLGGFTNLDGPTQTLPDLYELPSTDYHDIVSGNNGYAAGVGFDLASGIGAPIANLFVPDLASGQAITGQVWNDLNQDGLFDNGEPGISGITVDLETSGGTIISTTTTGSNGVYGFFADDGSYFVQVVRPTGFFFTDETNSSGGITSNVDPSGDSADFIISATHQTQTINAGLVSNGIQIGGVVFNDTDVNPITTLPNGTPNPLAYLPNGVFDNGESGPAGATVNLFMEGDSTAVATQTTGNGGGFNFTGIDPGSYYIMVVAPDGYFLTMPASQQMQLAPTGYTPSQFANDPTRQSMVDPSTGQSQPITLSINQKDLHLDAGVYQPRIFVQPTTLKNVAAGATEEMTFPATLYLFPGQEISNPITINYATEDESAIAGTDYEAAEGTSEFDPGPTQNQPAVSPMVTLIGNNISSPNKVFNLDVSTSQAQLIDPIVLGTIVSSVPDAITVNANSANVTETPGGVIANFTIQLAAPLDAPVTVYYTLGATGDTALGATPAEIENGTVKLSNVDYLAPSLTGSLTFPAGTVTETVPVLVLDNFGLANGFNITNTPTDTFTITLTSATTTSTDTAVSITTPSATGHITNDPVQNLNVTGSGTTYVDNSGHIVTVTLSGPGSAAVQKRGGESSDGIRIVLTGTTSASQLNIKSNGQTTISEIDDDSPLGAINAANVNLNGSMSLQGGLSKLTLNSITPVNLISVPGVTLAPGVQITIGGGPLGSVITLNANVGRVTDTTFDLGIPISSLKAASINNQNGEPSRIFGPTIGNLTVAGDFDENILTNSIGRLAVAGKIQNSSIRAAVSIGPVVAASLINSQIFAGVSSSITTLPTSDAAFTNASSSIKSITLRGNSAVFSNSEIAAGVVGPLQLGTVQPTTGGTFSGVAGLELISVRGSAGTLFSIPKETADLGTVFSDQDFLIQVYGV